MPKQNNAPFSLFSETQREAFLERFTKDNRWVAKNYLKDDTTNAFPPAFKNDTAPELSCLSHDQVARLIVELLSPYQGRQTGDGLIAGVRVALAGYPRMHRLLRAVIGRA